MSNSFHSPYILNLEQTKSMLAIVVENQSTTQLSKDWKCSVKEAETAIRVSADNQASQDQVLAAFHGLIKQYNEVYLYHEELTGHFEACQVGYLFEDFEVMEIVKQLNVELKDGKTVVDICIPEGKVLVKDTSEELSVYKYAYSHENVPGDDGWVNVTRYYLLGNSCDSPQQIEHTFNCK